MKPLAVVMENVPEMLDWSGRNVAEEVCLALEAHGYRASYTLLNAVHYGVPQYRERVFLVALHEAIRAPMRFPEPTHAAVLPIGYVRSRESICRRLMRRSLFGEDTHFVLPSVAPSGAPAAVTVGDAIDDLPPVPSPFFQRPGGATAAPGYRLCAGLPGYAKLMREWPGFSGGVEVADHVTREISNRDRRLVRLMSPGADYQQTLCHAEQLFAGTVRDLRRRPIRPSSVDALRLALVPPHSSAKFPSRWRMLDRGEPARTLMAHLGKDSYTHIHPDRSQARVISVRDAARLQSFPDGFRFAGGINAALRAIGNAVPPLMAYALASAIRSALSWQQSSPSHVAPRTHNAPGKTLLSAWSTGREPFQ